MQYNTIQRPLLEHPPVSAFWTLDHYSNFSKWVISNTAPCLWNNVPPEFYTFQFLYHVNQPQSPPSSSSVHHLSVFPLPPLQELNSPDCHLLILDLDDTCRNRYSAWLLSSALQVWRLWLWLIIVLVMINTVLCFIITILIELCLCGGFRWTKPFQLSG